MWVWAFVDPIYPEEKAFSQSCTRIHKFPDKSELDEARLVKYGISMSWEFDFGFKTQYCDQYALRIRKVITSL